MELEKNRKEKEGRKVREKLVKWVINISRQEYIPSIVLEGGYLEAHALDLCTLPLRALKPIISADTHLLVYQFGDFAKPMKLCRRSNYIIADYFMNYPSCHRRSSAVAKNQADEFIKTNKINQPPISEEDLSEEIVLNSKGPHWNNIWKNLESEGWTNEAGMFITPNADIGNAGSRVWIDYFPTKQDVLLYIYQQQQQVEHTRQDTEDTGNQEVLAIIEPSRQKKASRSSIPADKKNKISNPVSSKRKGEMKKSAGISIKSSKGLPSTRGKRSTSFDEDSEPFQIPKKITKKRLIRDSEKSLALAAAASKKRKLSTTGSSSTSGKVKTTKSSKVKTEVRETKVKIKKIKPDEKQKGIKPKKELEESRSSSKHELRSRRTTPRVSFELSEKGSSGHMSNSDEEEEFDPQTYEGGPGGKKFVQIDSDEEVVNFHTLWRYMKSKGAKDYKRRPGGLGLESLFTYTLPDGDIMGVENEDYFVGEPSLIDELILRGQIKIASSGLANNYVILNKNEEPQAKSPPDAREDTTTTTKAKEASASEKSPPVLDDPKPSQAAAARSSKFNHASVKSSGDNLFDDVSNDDDDKNRPSQFQNMDVRSPPVNDASEVLFPSRLSFSHDKSTSFLYHTQLQTQPETQPLSPPGSPDLRTTSL